MNEKAKINVFLDYDGTLFEYRPIVLEGGENYQEKLMKTLYTPGYYKFLNINDIMKELVNNLLKNENVNLYIATCVLPDKGESHPFADKLDAIKDNFPDFPIDHIIKIPDGTNKADYLLHYDRSFNKPGVMNIAIDDYNKNLEEYEAAGFYPVKCINGINSEHRNFPSFYASSIDLWKKSPKDYCDITPSQVAKDAANTYDFYLSSKENFAELLMTEDKSDTELSRG